jgi:sulfoxide reductase heme-binding subunit YedZ
MVTGLKINSKRLVTHGVMGVISLIGCVLASLYLPNATFGEVLTVGLGYVALLLLAVSLIIGPVNLLFKRRNPVNIDLRRDIGIWAGITGLAHVVFSFQVFQNGDILAYFLGKSPAGYTFPTPDLFTFSNYVGLIGTLIMAALLITSNQLSLRYLKGKRWKFLQRFNYPLAVLVAIHTFGYQAYNLREMVFIYSVIGLSGLVLVAQLGGVYISLQRKKQRQLETGSSLPTISPLQPVKPLNQQVMARRQFLILSGTAVLTGVTVGVVGGRALLAGNQAGALSASNSAGTATANPPTNTAAPQPAFPTPEARRGDRGQRFGNNGGFRGNPNTGSTSPTNPNTGNPSPANPNTGNSGATATTPATGQAPAASTANGKVVGTLASIPVGGAVQFTTPDTGEKAFLVHEADGSVKAFSGICTHRPYNLVFDNGQQALMCYLHGVPFNIQNGAPERGPARSALQSFKVSVDGQGNIVYSNS